MPPPTPIVAFAALQWECNAVLQALGGVRRVPAAGFARWRGLAGDTPVWVVKTGVGIERAGTAVGAAPAEARLVVSTGCAGGLQPDLSAGDLVIAAAVLDAAGAALPADAALCDAARRSAATAGIPARDGLLRCSPTLLTGVADKRAAARGGAVAVEMEGAPIARWSAERGLPFLAVRAVLDGAGQSLAIPAACLDPASGRIRPLALAAHLVTRPRTLSHLLALQRMQQAARTSLERFFRAWLG